MKETQIVRSVLEAFAHSGFCVLDHSGLDPVAKPSRRGIVWRANTGAADYGKRFIRFGVPGLPDICGILPGGKALFVEVKTDKGKLRTSQATFARHIISLDAYYFILRSYDEAITAIKLF